jgi:hypothetical protein
LQVIGALGVAPSHAGQRADDDPTLVAARSGASRRIGQGQHVTDIHYRLFSYNFT